jgi:hypothetical protein
MFAFPRWGTSIDTPEVLKKVGQSALFVADLKMFAESCTATYGINMLNCYTTIYGNYEEKTCLN